MSRAILIVALVPLLAGCVTREFWIVTDPPGVEIWIDGEPIKVDERLLEDNPDEPDEMRATPGRVLGMRRIAFGRYAVREIQLRKAGYESQTHHIDPDMPLWENFPFDFVTEVLVPVDIQLRFVFRFTLEEATRNPPEAAKAEADQTREYAGGRLADDIEKHRGQLAPR